MLDWLSSKFAMLLAVFIMIASIVGIFTLQSQNFARQELQNIAELIAINVNTVASSTSEAVIRITFNQSRAGILLPSQVKNKNYKLEITTNLVIVTCGELTSVSSFAQAIHVWNPGKLRYVTKEQLSLADFYIKNLTINSGEDFLVASRAVDSPEGYQYLTFVYPEKSEQVQAQAELVANEINALRSTTCAPLNLSALNQKKAIVARHRTTFRRGILIMKEQVQVCEFINCDYLWDPDQNNVSFQTTYEHLNLTDEALGNGFEVAPGESFWVERKVLELRDVEVKEGANKSALFTFLYK